MENSAILAPLREMTPGNGTPLCSLCCLLFHLPGRPALYGPCG